MGKAEAAAVPVVEVELPIIDLNSPDLISTAHSIRKACIEYGFFYVKNHGIESQVFERVFSESSKFFSLPLEHKMKLLRDPKHYRGYTPLFAENLDPNSSSSSMGDSKESFYIGSATATPPTPPLHINNATSLSNLNQWPPQALLPCWRSIMEDYYQRVLNAAKRVISLIAVSLNLSEDYFDKLGALDQPNALLRLIHYPGELGSSGEEIYGASAHSDYGMVTLLATDGVGGLQVCKDKSNQPRVWEDVKHIDGVFIVNIGDLMERWTNCLYRSTLHRVMPTGKERYSVAFFVDPNPDIVVECLKTCCSESSPPRFPPIRSGDYLEERFRLTYGHPTSSSTSATISASS